MQVATHSPGGREGAIYVEEADGVLDGTFRQGRNDAGRCRCHCVRFSGSCLRGSRYGFKGDRQKSVGLRKATSSRLLSPYMATWVIDGSTVVEESNQDRKNRLSVFYRRRAKCTTCHEPSRGRGGTGRLKSLINVSAVNALSIITWMHVKTCLPRVWKILRHQPTLQVGQLADRLQRRTPVLYFRFYCSAFGAQSKI